MSSNVSFSGLASGLNTTALVQNLLRFNQTRITQLQSVVTTDQSQQSAIQALQTKLQTLETQASQLASSQGSVFDGKTATTSDSTALSASAGTGAQSGVTSLKILSLAQASQVASQGYSDPNSAISQGTFTLQAGSKSATFTIDSTNNTLSGLAQSINSAGIGVTATIVNTGSSDPRTQPYRLLLTSNATGTANAIKITNNLGPDSNGAVQPNFASAVVGPAVTGTNFSGTSSISSNTGTNYTGTSNDTFTFTVLNNGTVGTDDGIQVSYTNSSGTKTGTLTINASDVGTAKSVVDGVQVTFGAGSLKANDQFTVNVFSPTIQAATNSQVQIGSGDGAIIVQNSSNTVSNLIPGVTLSLKSADPNKTVQLNVSNDVDGATKAITDFVNDYNDFMTSYNTQTKYTPGTGTAAGTSGPLNGNTSLITVQSQLAQTILAVAPNLPSQVNRLGAIGISPDSNGLLQIDTTTLNNALSGGISGVSFNDIKNLFSLQGQSSSSGVQFATGSSKTVPTGSTPYTVHVTQAATRASITGSATLGTNTVIDSSNNALTLSLDGKSAITVNLAPGSYSQLGLANEIQTELNAALASSGASVVVTTNNNQLSISSGSYGSASKINSLSGSAIAALGFSGSETSTGTDVQGSFIVNGVTETAKGVGQILTGLTTNTNTADLAVVVTLNPSQIQAGGTDSTLSVTRGIASSLDNALKSLLDPVDGTITMMANQITQSITDAQTEVTNQTNAMNDQQTQLMQQFAALETVLSNLQQTSNLLTSMLSSSSSSSGSSSSSSAATSAANYSNPTSSSSSS